jgi:phosphate:Na+ symporter
MIFFLSISKMLAGIGFFIMGMNFMEESLRKLAGRSFKLFLRHQTDNKFKAILGGTIVTAVLQSSSVVSLMVLSFVGAGVITMQNALAVILGANIGTTLDSWVVATLGFAIDIESFSLPIAGVGAIAMAFFTKGTKAYTWSKFSFGFGALFIGIDFMKNSFADLASRVDFLAMQDYPMVVFVLVGLALTTIIQSSSATVAITLSALHANAITLYPATAIVLGSEVGTTVKLWLASINGAPAKKRVALGNFLYNTLLIVVVMLALSPINILLTEVIQFKDPLIALVFFQTFINILGVIVFFPFLHYFETFLLKQFTESQTGTRYLKLVPTTEGDLALEALDKEVKRFIGFTFDFHLHAFDLSELHHQEAPDKNFHGQSFIEKYEYLKLFHGEIHTYYISMDKDLLESKEREYAERLISAVRNSMFSAKSIKDSRADIEQLKNSSSQVKFDVYKRAQQEVETFFHELTTCLAKTETATLFQDVQGFYKRVESGYSTQLQKFYNEQANHQLTEVDISTLINFNREYYASHKAIVLAMKDYLLEKDQAAYFAELPSFFR